MGSIIKKKIKNQIYYYYVESKRINGKPKLVNQKYLGTAGKLLEKAQAYDMPLQSRVLYSDECEFGAVSLLYDIAKRLGITEMIHAVVPKRKQGGKRWHIYPNGCHKPCNIAILLKRLEGMVFRHAASCTYWYWGSRFYTTEFLEQYLYLRRSDRSH